MFASWREIGIEAGRAGGSRPSCVALTGPIGWPAAAMPVACLAREAVRACGIIVSVSRATVAVVARVTLRARAGALIINRPVVVARLGIAVLAVIAGEALIALAETGNGMACTP